MGYSKDAITYVNEMYSIRRRKSASELLEKKAELYSVEPRLREIEKQLADCGLKTVRCVVSRTGEVKDVVAKLRDESLRLQQERIEILRKMGFPANFLEPAFECERCKDEGFIDGKMCNCYIKELKKYTYNSLNKNSHLQLCDFSKFDLKYYPDTILEGTSITVREKMKQIYNFCVSYASDFSEKSGNILMSGATGLGKTFLSLSIAKAAIDRGYGVVYASAQNLLNNLEKEKFSNNTSADMLDDILDCDLLIIDDLGAEFSTSFTVATVYNIVNSRINTGKPVIINTNLSLEELQNKYSERITSRFIGEYTILKFAGNDIRQMKRTEESKDE